MSRSVGGEAVQSDPGSRPLSGRGRLRRSWRGAAGGRSHDPNDTNGGGHHGLANARGDIDGGRMDGFVREAEGASRGCGNPDAPQCRPDAPPDVMGWHDAREIPNYWAYAKTYVLQDHLFEPNASWSLPAHPFLVSEW